MVAADRLDMWIEYLSRRPPILLHEGDLKILCEAVKLLLIQENNVHPLQSPVTICGDIHGQFYDLLELFKVGGSLRENTYIFLGDYVDRGRNSVETIQYLLAMKLKYPSNMILLRGNHESRQITTVYGFYDECLQKYGNPNVWKYCSELFDYLTLAAIIDDRILCVHGGLSPELTFIDQFRLINRIREIPSSGAFSDILWSDPDSVEAWEMNPRGSGWLFGEKATAEFNHKNGIDLLARAHQLVMDGFQYSFAANLVVTVWSAPNYCYRCQNVAAIMHIDDCGHRSFYVFRHTPEELSHPPAAPIAPFFV